MKFLRRAIIATIGAVVIFFGMWLPTAAPASASWVVCHLDHVFSQSSPLVQDCLYMVNTGTIINGIELNPTHSRNYVYQWDTGPQNAYGFPKDVAGCYVVSHVWGPHGSPSWQSPRMSCYTFYHTYAMTWLFYPKTILASGIYCDNWIFSINGGPAWNTSYNCNTLPG
jgi:hypothetical protein